jgi:two-component system, sensor histidine kinase
MFVMWTLVGLSLVASYKAELAATASGGRNLMIAFREEVASILRGVEGEMDEIAEKMRHQQNKFDLYAWGLENMLVSPGMAQATIIQPDGQLGKTTVDPHPPAIDLSDRAHFKIHLDGKFHGLYIGKPLITRISGLHTLPISRRVEDDDGTFLGVIVVLVTPSALTRLHKSIDLGPNGLMTLAGLDNILLARFSADSPDGTTRVGAFTGGGQRPAVFEENAQGSFTRASVVDGITRLFTYSRIGSYPLVVTVGLELDRELAGWRSYAATIVAMMLGATLLMIWSCGQSDPADFPRRARRSRNEAGDHPFGRA